MKISEVVNKIKCFLGLHEWISKIEENVKMEIPDNVDLKTIFYDYSKIYCKHCRKISKYSLKLRR